MIVKLLFTSAAVAGVPGTKVVSPDIGPATAGPASTPKAAAVIARNQMNLLIASLSSEIFPYCHLPWSQIIESQLLLGGVVVVLLVSAPPLPLLWHAASIAAARTPTNSIQSFAFMISPRRLAYG